MPHSLVAGTSYCGKSTLMRRICRAGQMKNRGVFLLGDDPDGKWKSEIKPEVITTDKERFMRVAKANQRKTLVVDDALDDIGHNPKEMKWLGTYARHEFHTSLFGTQSYTGFSTVLRGQCEFIYCFRIGRNSAKAMAEEFGRDEFLDCPRFPLGTFLFLDRSRDYLKKHVLFTPKI